MKNSLAKIVPVLVLFGTLLSPVWAAEGSSEPPFRFYSTVDGITQSVVTDIDQDKSGHLWFTTRRGLNRYNGKDFEHFTIADGLPTNEMTALFVAADDTVWVGDDRGGLAAVQSTRVSHIVEPIDDTNTPILDIAYVGDRLFVLAEGAGVLEVLADGPGYRFKALGGVAIGATAISVGKRNTWIVADTGLYRLLPGSEFQLEKVSSTIRLVHSANDGTVWVANSNSRIGTWNGTEFELRAILPTSEPLTSLVTSHDGKVWIATEDELFVFDGNQTNRVQSGDAIREYNDSRGINSLFVDRENTLWLSSRSRLTRFLGDRFRHFRLQTQADSETVWAIGEDNQGRQWFGTQSSLLIRNKDESLVVVGPAQGVPHGAVRDLVFDADGMLWAGVRGKGLYRVDPVAIVGELIAGTEGLEILDVAASGNGTIWFSTFDSGVYRYSPASGVLSNFLPPSPTPVFTIDAWDDNSIWYGADDVGIVHLRPRNDDTFEQVVFESTGKLKNKFFNHLKVVGDGELWVAMEEGGLYKFESGEFTQAASDSPWADQTVYLVEVLDNGSIVTGGEQGLYQFFPGSGSVAHYNQRSGFLGVETNVHAVFFDSDRYLWIGTVHGATRMDTTLPMPAQVDPTPQIIRMESGLDRLPISDQDEIDPRQQGVHVEFAAVSLLDSSGIQYSYKLIGRTDEWGPATLNRTVNFSQMPPGSFEFVVRARYPGGAWGTQLASRRFTVLPFFWQEPWLITAAAFAVLLIFGLSAKYWTRLIALQNERLRALVAQRTRTIEMAKEKLQNSNEKLSREIHERQKSEKARVEVETRFRRAFEHAPIGMGLLDVRGYLFDANPVLRNMLWPDSEPPAQARFADLLEDEERENFDSLYGQLSSGEIDDFEGKYSCSGQNGNHLRTLISLSAVRSENTETLYSVLQVQDVTESRRLTEQLEYQASYDDLTGLLNRRSFEAELAQVYKAESLKGSFSFLMLMDLDQFKVVNDTSGHAAGDQLLRNVGDILMGIVRTNDIVARLGGDEFGIILRRCPTDVALRIAESIRQSIEKLRFPWGSEIYRIGVSIGGLPIDPSLGDEGELQQLADAACYAAKEAGRNRVHMVDGDKDSALLRRGQVRWVQRLREAMDNNRFALYGQVIKPLNADTNEPERLEILLRLRDPLTRRLIPPGAFLPAAERYGLSIELDQWVIRNLLDMLFVHQTVATEYRKYWVNLSGTSIGDQRFADFLVDAIRKSPLPRGTVNFEITETAVIRSVVEAGNLMSELRGMGCEFALDDFGSGLSSFGYLKKLPVDYLKIDGMFIRDIVNDKTNQIFVKSIIDIAHTLDIKTIAEFVENDEMLELMRTLGADYVQGFGIGRPYALAPSFPTQMDTGGLGTLANNTAGRG